MLKINGLTKIYGRSDVKAVDDLSLEVESGEIFGFIGPNGAGKSTTIKCVTGITGFNAGTIEVNGFDVRKNPIEAKRSIGYVSDSHVVYDQLTGAEYVDFMASIYGVADKESYKSRLENYIDVFGLKDAFNEPIKSYSHGMQQKINVIGAIIHNPPLLILDEPSAALTDIEVEGLFAIMRKLIGEGKSIIFISHKMREVLHISDRITVLRLGEVVGTVNRADTDGQKLANMMIGKELSESQYEKKDASGAEVVAELSHVDYDKEHKHSGVNDMSLKIHRGEIVGIAGVDGNGQTQLAQLITGVIAPQSGNIYLKDKQVAVFDPNAFITDNVSHVPEDRNAQGLIGDMSIAENLVLKATDQPQFSKGHGLLLNKPAIHEYAEEMVKKYDVRCTSTEQTVRSLSGGNQQKVILARELESQPSLLVMAHPTRGLDIGAAGFVHEQMIAARQRGVGILLISADFDEILEMSDRILVCFEGQIMGEYSGKNPPIEEISLAMTGK